MNTVFLVLSCLTGLSYCYYLPSEDSTDQREFLEQVKYHPIDYSEFQEILPYLFARGRRQDKLRNGRGGDETAFKEFSRVYRGGKPLFLSNHADAVLRGLG
ncbi:uncharacterized protein LOC111716215 [Eurytemora carolleeae]|uniref:uncharacterized protein LOC111716215 n=1 Tax=Eurytemora carolleeae TaxID=1294199 RepID=UPI000C792015|nr:uncharacterized protein LOC111716215 [Eurytemora carolleeae]|eukprot:XP_023347424.1 uncharacterized protein LOC111716215 [Eurytemora affinis]